MPLTNGYETAAELYVQYQGINILALSMYDSESSIIKMLPDHDVVPASQA